MHLCSALLRARWTSSSGACKRVRAGRGLPGRKLSICGWLRRLLKCTRRAVVMRQRVNWVLEKARRGEAFSEFERVTVQRDRAFVVRLCMQAVNRLFDVSGGHALFLSEPLQRCHRDAQAVAHRAGLMLETVGPAYGRVALSTPPALLAAPVIASPAWRR